MIKPIKKFEEFINESFNSGKLRSIIKQNGYPKYSWDKRLLHDIQDSDVIGVCSDREEYTEKYKNDGKGYGFKKENGEYIPNKTFYIELKNGKLLVLKNFDIIKDEVESLSTETLTDRIMKMKNDRRKNHVGYEKEDRLASKRENSVFNEQEKRKFIAKFFTDENKNELSKYVEDMVEGWFISDMDPDNKVHIEKDKDVIVGGKEINIAIEYDVWANEPVRRYGEEISDIIAEIDGVSFYFQDDDIEVDAFKYDVYTGKTRFVENDVSIGIYDYYQAYGIDPRDFY